MEYYRADVKVPRATSPGSRGRSRQGWREVGMCCIAAPVTL